MQERAVQRFVRVQAAHTSGTTADVIQWSDGNLFKPGTVEATPEPQAQGAKDMGGLTSVNSAACVSPQSPMRVPSNA